MSNVQEQQRLRIMLEPAKVNMKETFPEGMLFKKAELQYKFDREKKELTDELEAIRITATDKATLEDFQVKVPLEVKQQVEHLKPFQDVSFVNMTGTRVGYNTYLKADNVKVSKNE